MDWIKIQTIPANRQTFYQCRFFFKARSWTVPIQFWCASFRHINLCCIDTVVQAPNLVDFMVIKEAWKILDGT